MKIDEKSPMEREVAARILYATAESYPTYRPDVRVLFGESLPACGIQVDLLALIESESGPLPVNWSGGRLFARRAITRAAQMKSDLIQQLSLLVRVRRGYDALVVRDKPILGVIGFFAARLARVPFVYWMSYPLPESYLWHARQPEYPIGKVRRAWLTLRGRAGLFCLNHLLVPKSDWLFVQTSAMEHALRKGALSHDRVTPVPMGVDADAVPPPTSVLPPELRDRPLAVYLGTLDRSRQLGIIVDAAALVAQRLPGFVLLLIGDVDTPVDRGWLQAHAAKVGAQHAVYFTGRMASSEAMAWVQNAHVGVSPVPRTELTEVGSPTKAVEYLACGLPVVCNDQPDQAAVVEQSGGGWLCPFTAAGFAEGILASFENPADARVRGAAGREWVSKNRSYRVLGRMVADKMFDVIRSARR